MSDTILGIHSNVRPGMIDPSTGKPTDPGLTDGHGWLPVARDGKTTTYGLWPDDHSRVVEQGWNNGEGSDVRAGMEDKSRGHAASGLVPQAWNLLRDSGHHVRQLAERHGLPWNPGMDNTVAAVAQQARADGLTGINQFNVKDGQIRYGQYDGYTLKDGRVDARVAANTPEAVSRDGLAQTDQAMNQQQPEQALPERSPPALQRA
ncbi:MAG: hypothetical protein IV088_09400 [Hydrogenophaga sp.]|uniref:hypothetical protein n=1 Tax=Hydrogenophaga sp. TaxID=1904254 RepID=UPI0025BB6AA9|nr:hypothetical protein [Hydrogenophaga sp.]MBT9551050.1 hypothetical protein [Hydrogenophaga sp.]